MSKPDIPKTPDPPQPDAPAARLIQPAEDSPVNAAKKKMNLRRYLTAGDSQSTAQGVGVQL
ncbi:hypothetical protein [Burkholderia cepacia]|uniref:hypothetical protein n=1 Tax=Burkholderia cepacia TaxID=292 RepID=UPI000757FBF7|nr:hypothetical protein [Burkholderia cepacia]KWH50732.1 hypothetical protein WM00_20735 [Burkholderia cepacia]